MRVTSISIEVGGGGDCVRIGMQHSDLFLHGSYAEIRAFAQAVLDAAEAHAKVEAV